MRAPGIEISLSQSNTVFTKLLISINFLGLDILEICRANSPTNELQSVLID